MTTYFKSIIASSEVSLDGMQFAYTGTFTGNLLGTSSHAISASWAPGGSESTPALITKNIVTSGSLISGNFVNIFNDSIIKCRQASAELALPVDGYVLNNYNNNVSATVYFEGTYVSSSANFVPGINYYLFNSGTIKSQSLSELYPGTSSISCSTWISQKVGKAISNTEIYFRPSEPITLG